MNALALIQAAVEPTEPFSWVALCRQFVGGRRRVSFKGRPWAIEGSGAAVGRHEHDGTLFIQDTNVPPAKRELLSFRVMNNQLTLQDNWKYLFSVSIYEALRKHPTPTSMLKYLFEIIDDYAGDTTNAEAAAEPESDRAPGLTALIKRSTPDQERARANAKRVPSGWFVGVGAHTFSDGKQGLIIYVTDEDRRQGYWSFIVRALPEKYMLQFLGVGHRDRMKPDVTKDAAWRVVRNGDFELDTPADILLGRAIRVAVDYVIRNEDRPEYLVRAAAEPSKDSTASGDAVRALLQSPSGLKSYVGKTIDAGDYVVRVASVSDLLAELYASSKKHGMKLFRVYARIEVAQSSPGAKLRFPGYGDVSIHGNTPKEVLQNVVPILVEKWKQRYGHLPAQDQA